jgi:hypothetical protein
MYLFAISNKIVNDGRRVFKIARIEHFVLWGSQLEISKPRHDQTNIMGLRPALIQTSLRIRAVWSGSMLFAYKLYNK